MKKQGFTLIELMVVVVIIGILAAVAVPKLFGMIAKSKASEVGPAAGTYVKLQQAYFAESGKAGGWTLIGYTAPNGGETTNFYYGIGSIGTQASTTVSSSTLGWSASNRTALNECAAGSAAAKEFTTASNWNVYLAAGASVQDVAFSASANGAGCVALTPTFDKIGK